MNVEIGAEAALFPEKEYINGIAVAVRSKRPKANGPTAYKDVLDLSFTDFRQNLLSL